MRVNKTLDVYYHGMQVGTLAETPDKRIAFQYSSEWQKNGFSISPFSLPLRNDVFVPNERSLERFGGLFGVFADSLPDSWGQLLLDRHLETLGITRSGISTLERLAYVGKNGMGALEYLPSKESDFDFKGIGLDFDTIAKECENILSSKESNQLDILFKMGGSSGGTRPKILISENNRDWIIKFPSKSDPEISGKREFDYSLCAKGCGISMTETELIPSTVCEGYFKTERFERRDGEKIFTITFAALLEADFRAPSCDYETFFKLTKALTKDAIYDKEQMYRIMCFNIAAHNRDDHTKNFSFTHSDLNGWKLAPAYDITYSDTYWGEHTTSVNGKGKDITKEDLIKVGCDAGLTEKFCLDCLEEIEEKVKMLDNYLKPNHRKTKEHIHFKERISEINGL
ncbi:serine/threonine-protein kinase HipA [Pseudobutyrivibrio sp. ACV-2]|uniref:type II toxin-antitoxin system HipA family toxin n=1 Tax=Pseudobutyrivibrio sp. ACV-2 TaxID=1520801 RepID=UPI00089A7F97|nr:type II toxin-antitoxin system HipA family toxin [Pseudobutyrivibrio sp. ACV-2]SEA55522.1 serine/threonine-protein kinase HipA [Pseudobutyrivibrio sp. ACV-2]